MPAYGSPPAPDELELTVFGPGKGEAIAVHYGDGQWFVVDSCVRPDNGRPAVLHYFQDIGVSPDAVKAVLASHWHDDHIKGISQVADACKNAEIFVSGIFSDEEATTVVSAYGGGGKVPSKLTSGTRELYALFDRHNPVPIYQRMTLIEPVIQNRTVRISAFSPTHQAQRQWHHRILSYIPKAPDEGEGVGISHAPEIKSNLTAVVVHIDLGDDALLLGADMERHRLGWRAILNLQWCLDRTKASVFKVAHHGGKSGHHDRIWTDLLRAPAVAALTPFSSSRLPSPDDRARIKRLASNAYLTSTASTRPKIESTELKTMERKATGIAKADAGFGAVRLRRKIGTKAWAAQLFEGAHCL